MPGEARAANIGWGINKPVEQRQTISVKRVNTSHKLTGLENNSRQDKTGMGVSANKMETGNRTIIPRKSWKLPMDTGPNGSIGTRRWSNWSTSTT